LGAKVLKKLSRTATHYIFQDGNEKKLKQARQNVKIVTPSWIQKCKELHSHVDETDYLIDQSLVSSKQKKSAGHLSTTSGLQFENFDDEHSSSDVDAIIERGSTVEINTIASSTSQPSPKKVKDMVDAYVASAETLVSRENQDKPKRKRGQTRSRKVLSPSPEPPIDEEQGEEEQAEPEIEEKPKKKIKRKTPKKRATKKKQSTHTLKKKRNYTKR